LKGSVVIISKYHRSTAEVTVQVNRNALVKMWMPAPPVTPPSLEQPAPPSVSNLHLFKADALLADETAPYLTVRLPPGTDTHAIHVQADHNVAILYPSPWTQSTGIYLLDLTTGTSTKLTGPDPTGWYAYAHQLPDGRLLLVGDHIWLGDPAQDKFETIAEVALTWLVEPSPSGRHLALWGPNAPGN
jgi:hypothetical protein